MIRSLQRLCSGGLLAVLVGVGPSHGEIVGFTNFDDFVDAAVGVQRIIDFESVAAGTQLSDFGAADDVIPGVEIVDIGGDNLTVLADSPGDTISPDNYVGNDFNFGRIDAFQEIVISFDDAFSAVGLWVQFDPELATNNGTLQLSNTLGEGSANQSPDFSVPLENDTAFFLGLVDSTGTDSLTSVRLTEVDFGDISYTFDNLTTFSVAAIPEPGSLLLLSIVGGAAAMRRPKRLAGRRAGRRAGRG